MFSSQQTLCDIHFLALSLSKGARLVMSPAFLQTMIAAMQTMDWTRKKTSVPHCALPYMVVGRWRARALWSVHTCTAR